MSDKLKGFFVCILDGEYDECSDRYISHLVLPNIPDNHFGEYTRQEVEDIVEGLGSGYSFIHYQESLTIQNALERGKKVREKREEEQRIRSEKAKKAAEKRKENALEKKRKQLEKLKKELGE